MRIQRIPRRQNRNNNRRRNIHRKNSLEIKEKKKMTTLKEVIKETLEEMNARQLDIVFTTLTKEEAIQKRKDALTYVMEQLEHMDRILRLGF